jgi:glycosidase
MMKIKFLWLAVISLVIGSACNSAPKQEEENQSEEVKVVEKQIFNAPDWTKNANIYEVNLRQYSEEGNLQAFAKQLPRLKEMGVDILWFMPIHPIGELNRKGSLGSYYAVRDYKAVNPEFGTFEDFKMVVDQAHDLGMYVMLDWVANHTSWDNVWVENHEDFYEKDSTGKFISPFDWTDVISLDYSNREMRDQMIDALKFWVADANIDGYRCDVASEVPTDFWEEARPQLQAIKPVFMLAESEQVDLLEAAFDMNYGWEFHHIMNQVAKGEKTPADILDYLNREKAKTPQRAYMMYFITNHDENSWNGTIKERLGDADEAFAILSWTLGGMPLIYSGQEAANEKRLEFFEKDPIDWKDYPKADFYKSLNELKHQTSAIWNGAHGGVFEWLPTDKDNQVLAFKKKNDKEELMVLLNLSDQEFQAQFTDHDLLDFKPLLMKNFQPTMEINSFTMMPYGYCVLKKALK